MSLQGLWYLLLFGLFLLSAAYLYSTVIAYVSNRRLRKLAEEQARRRHPAYKEYLKNDE